MLSLIVFATLCSVILLKVVSFLLKRYKSQKLFSKIPGPPALFFFGHTYILLLKSEHLFKRIRKYSKQFYPIYRFTTPYANVVHLLEPNDIELVLASTKHLSKSKVYSFLHNWLGTGLLTSSGAKWHQRRKILTPAFHFTILQQFVNIFNEESKKLVDKIQEQSGNDLDVVPPITNFTLQSIAETAMGFNNVDETSQRKYKEAIYKMGAIIISRVRRPWFFINAFYKLSQLFKEESQTVKILHDFSNKIIKEREVSSVVNDKKKRLAMLDLLLAAKNKGIDIDYEGIREEVDTFMFEGHDTTSMGISFLLLTLANLPEIQEKVLQEILEVIGTTNSPTFDDLQKLRYTERVIKESLRLFPSVPFISRWSSEDFTTTTGYRIPKGTIIHIHIFDVHRNEKIYPDPLKFDPDRFLPELANRRHPFAYIPFSAGPRNCIGQRFALLELKAALCGVLRTFKLEKVDDMYGIDFKPDLVLRPIKDVNIKFIKRY